MRSTVAGHNYSGTAVVSLKCAATLRDCPTAREQVDPPVGQSIIIMKLPDQTGDFFYFLIASQFLSRPFFNYFFFNFILFLFLFCVFFFFFLIQYCEMNSFSKSIGKDP